MTGTRMAFRGDAAAVLSTDGSVSAADLGLASFDKPKVDRADAMRVRVALGLMFAVALADCLLYLPRLF